MTKLRFFLGCFLAFVGIALLLRLTQPKTPPKPYRPFVRPQTWHLSGWKLVGGKQLPWELWGRTEPPLSYERIGDSVEWMDSTQKIVLTPSLPGYTRVHLTQLKPSANNQLVLLQNWGSEALDPEAQLPVSYQIQGKQHQEGELRAEYNLALPREITSPPSFTGPTLDLQAEFVSSRTSFVGRGVSLLVTLLTEDQEGNLRAQVEVRPGTAPIKVPYTIDRLRLAEARYVPPPPPTPQPNAGRGGGVIFPGDGGGGGQMTLTNDVREVRNVTDNQGKNYILQYLSGSVPPARYTLRLIRVTPLIPQLPRPKHLLVPISTELRWSPAFLPYFREQVLSRAGDTVTLPLPASLPQEKTSVAQRQKDAEARGRYYQQLTFGSLFSKQAKQELRAKSLFWYKRARKPAPKDWGK